jgi:hypothetical protein
MNRYVLLTLLFSALLLVGVSCGGGAGSFQPEGAKDVQGITEAGFNLVRYDDQGNATNALNPTLDLAVQQAADTTTVRIAIDDKQPTLGVTCDLHYDAGKYTPVDVEFSGLIDTQVELASSRNSGLVAVGQVSTDGAQARSGQFATVTFRNEPNRNVSASGDAADKPINTTYSANGFSADGFTAVVNSGAVDVNILGIFTSLSGDGDQNGVSSIADLTPLGGALGHGVTATDAASARADYDGNGLPNISDLTSLGGSLGEVTTGIELYAGDADPPTTLVHTFDWNADGDPPVPTSSITADPSDIWRQFQFTIDATTAGDLDAPGNGGNNDGHIFVAARAITSSASGAPGPLSTPAFDLDLGGAVVSNFVVSDVDFEINGTPVNDGDTVQLEANSLAVLQVTGFTGTYNGTPFASGDVGGTVPQGDYDTELAAIQLDFYNWISDETNQELNPGTFADFQTDKDAVLLNFVNGGTTANATVFPDDDPGNAAEGSLTLGFSRNNNSVADATVTLDVTPDPNAAVINSISGSAGTDGDGNFIITGTSPDIKGNLDFPGGPPGAFDDNTIDVEIVDLTNGGRLPIDFDVTVGPPTAGGTFSIGLAVTSGYDFDVRVPAGALSADNLYMVRFYNPAAENGSSVNKPGDAFLTGGTVSTSFASTILPRHNVNADEHTIAIIPADPQILRNPQQDYNVISGTVDNAFDGAGDVLKASGDSFTLQFAGGLPYPEVVVKVGADPSVILDSDTPGSGEPVGVPEINPHRIVLDLTGLNPATTTTYAYKVFGAPVVAGNPATRPEITSGTFTIKAVGEDEFISNIHGEQFGVNVYDGLGGGDLLLGNEDWSNKLLSFGNLPANFGDSNNDADVLFVEFNGGHVIADPYVNGSGGGSARFGYTGSSVKVKLLEMSGTGGFAQVPLDVRISGVGNGSLDYIGLAHFTQNDNGGPLGLVPTLEYEVQLLDAFGPTFSFGPTPADPHVTVTL